MSRLPTAVSDAYKSLLASAKERVDKLNQAFDVATLTSRTPAGSTTAVVATTTSTPSRVTRRPVFGDDETPLNLARVVHPTQVMTSADFASSKELRGHDLLVNAETSL